MLIPSSPERMCPAATVPKAEAKGASLSSFTTFPHAAAATPPCTSPRFVQSCSSHSHSPSPPRGSGAPPFQSSGFREAAQDFARVSYQEQAWNAARR